MTKNSQANLYEVTPYIFSRPLTHELGKDVFLKLETFQPSGSFKNRALGYLAQHLIQTAQTPFKGFVTFSGGNAGLALAYTGHALGYPVKVIVPETCALETIERLRAQPGTEVQVFGENVYTAEKAARELALTGEWCYVSPFDHPALWEGNSTLIKEIATQNNFTKPGAIVCSVGGGGLLGGILLGLRSQGWSDVPVLAVETTGAACFHASMLANKPVVIDKIDTIAGTLGSRYIATGVWDLVVNHPGKVTSHVVTDAEALIACKRFLNDHNMLVEPSCGASLAIVYRREQRLLELDGPITVIACGGKAVSVELLDKWSQLLGV
ncbi:serine dehydratase-like protein [Basidiobolus meristosporus CBS 931.73]|uniref:L-serine ammonia-lyase n=1 Tax=Basidiobolus meristosporus CBS 931.73 TaxID=1314790 RepID=A0A1Y1X672_9FUNG|nr:serine dehydratase-like protein [Basidiobolus meristosporus CBS 931.73]|eukprot:ORX80804.1 serine dehydratase-like protein [Basidiobolus meristosporus CBS 931.73]